jgi:hypothetical protein
LLARIFASLDGKGTESGEGNKGDSRLNAADWIHGPGGLMVNKSLKDLEERISRYNFIPGMEASGNNISGKGNLERFEYWLNVFRFNKAALEVAKTQVELNSLADSIKKTSSPQEKLELAKKAALPKRIELARKWEEMNHVLLSFVSSNGELGTIANLEMHNIRMNGNLTGHDEFLKSVLKSDLPPETMLSSNYSGKTRIICTTLRTILDKGEDFFMRIRVLSENENLSGNFFYRPLGAKVYEQAGLVKTGAHVFEVRIPANKIPDDFEYYIEVSAGNGKFYYPATFKAINNSVIIL